MTYFRLRAAAALLGVFCVTGAHAQQSPTTATVPRLVRFSGSFRPANGQPAPSVESVTLSVYRDQTGGTALWQEIQNVALDADGNYSLVMGATQTEGMPMDLFASGEPRWLGTQINRPGEVEQPRALMVSVPYALKASDAETLGGKPASAYLLAAPVSLAVTGNSAVGSTPASTAASTTVVTPVKPKTTAGIMNFVAKFLDSSGDLTNSTMYDTNGFVGFGTTAPSHRLHVFNSSPIVDSNLNGQLYVQNTYPSNSQGHASLVLDKGSSSASAALSFNSVGTEVWDVGTTDDNNFHIRSLSTTNTKPLTIERGAAANSLYINAAGNVGLGTLTAASKLDVAGDINFSGSVRFGGSPLITVPGGAAGQSIALGLGALANNSTGTGNSAFGSIALQQNTAGSLNTATGVGALQLNVNGGSNTATGFNALLHNTGGSGNTAIGAQALIANQTGSNNTALGNSALQDSTTGTFNLAIGASALFFNTTGSQNTAIGPASLESNSTGNSNIAIGYLAANNVSSGNSNNIHIGSLGLSGDNATTRIGDAGTQSAFFAAGIRGVTTGSNNAVAVVIDSNGQLGTVSSSRRFKEDIEDMGTASNGLMRLRPVTYRYKQPFDDGSKPIQYGLIAEEVSEVYPDLVAHSADGQIETVKYQVLEPMLLNEVQRQQAEIGAQRDQVRRLEQQINEQQQQNQNLLERLAKLEAVLASTSGESRVH